MAETIDEDVDENIFMVVLSQLNCKGWFFTKPDPWKGAQEKCGHKGQLYLRRLKVVQHVKTLTL